MSEKTNKKWYERPIGMIGINLLCNIIFYIVFICISTYNIFPVIHETKNSVDSLKIEVSKIKNNYILKDKGGIDINVGINSKLIGNNIIVFKNNSFGLKYTQVIILSNPIDKNNFNPTVQLLVTEEVNRNDDKSEAEIFISKDAAFRLGLENNLNKGVFKLKMKQKEKEDKI